MRNVWKGLLVLAAALIFCTVPGVSADAKVNVKKVTVKSNYGTQVHVATGKKVKLTTTVKVTPNKAANKKVTYKSSNKKIATVSSSGNVKGVKTGTCKITVTSKKNKKKKAKITVKVVKKVTSVKMKETSVTIPAGQTKTLKTTVLPATGSYKKVTWSTSNKKIATVSSTGLVKGIAPGTVTIKATSVEGSKKSASCKVKVLSADSVNLTDVQVLSKNAVRITLDKAKTLTASQIAVEGKKYTFGTYTRKYVISQLRNYDNKTYDLSLDEDYSISADSFVRVTINSLPGNGTKSLETQALFVKNAEPKTEKWIGVVGDRLSETVDLSEYCYGNISYKVTGSVGGISWKVKNNELIFSGTYTTVTVGTIVTVQATDEMGNVVTKKIQIAVGNASTVVGRAENMTLLVGETLDNAAFAEAAGGSGEYSYTAGTMPQGLKLNEDGTISGTASGVGEYTVQISVTDKANSSRTARVSAEIRVVDQKKVAGTVLNAAGQPVSGAEIVCENVSDGTVFETKTDAEGKYSLYVAEGSYNISATFAENTDSVYNIAVSTGGRQISFVLQAKK